MLILIGVTLIAWFAVGAFSMMMDGKEILEALNKADKSAKDEEQSEDAQDYLFNSFLASYCGPIGWLCLSLVCFRLWRQRKELKINRVFILINKFVKAEETS